MLRYLWIVVFLPFLFTALPASAQSESGVPVVVFQSVEGERDHAFISATRSGIEHAQKDLGVIAEEISVNGGNLENSLRKIAKGGAPLIIAAGSQFVIPVMRIAEDFPDTKFTVIDGMLPNIFANIIDHYSEIFAKNPK